MLEWTGERFLPWVNEPSLAYEHLHRYAYAAALVRGKRTLDLASGEGYGANLLAQQAAAVIGVDIDAAAVEHAGARYGNRGVNVQFLTGTITNVPIPDDHSFDAIVCFEAIEHVDDQAALLNEVKRLLKPDGLFIVSTPNKTAYQEKSIEENPFHLKELTFSEFNTLLSTHFRFVRFLGQQIRPQSSIWPLDAVNAPAHQEFTVCRNEKEFDFIANDQRVPLYFIALASDNPEQLVETASGLTDESDMLIREKDRSIHELLEGKASLEKALAWRETQLAEYMKRLDESLKSLQSAEEGLAWKESLIRELNEGVQWLRTQVAEADKTIATNTQTMASQLDQISSYQAQLKNAQWQLEQRLEELHRIQSSRAWKFVLKVRHIWEVFSGLWRSR